MYVVCVDIHIKPDQVDAFAEAIAHNHNGSVQEPGCARFDVLQDAADPAHFMLYEVYYTEDDFKAHQQTAHFAHWRETVQDCFAAPRTRVIFRSLNPEPWM